MAEDGFKSILIPEEYGGAGGSMLDFLAVMEEVAAGGGAINASSSIHIPMLCIPAILNYGSEEQKRTLLPKISDGSLFITFGVTEPDAGTETTRIRTAATPDGDGWRLNGAKVWNSGAFRGDKVLVLARTGKPGPDQPKAWGLSLFLTDLSADTISMAKIPKIGRNAVASAELFFDDHPLRAEDLVGELHRGFYHLLDSLNGERLILSAVAIGLGRWAVENAADYARERVVFGRAIGQNQAVQHPIAKSYVNLLAASELLRRAGEEYEAKGGRAIGSLANACKYVCTEAGFSACDDAMQVFGGYSFAREYHIGRHWIEARLQKIAPVNNQMVLNFVAENDLDLPRSY
jgi:acyl-CoA dehydrogenase